MRCKYLLKQGFLIALILCIPALSFGSDIAKLQMKNSTVASVINVLSNQYGYSFVYQTNEINPERLVSIEMTNADVEQVLQMVFKDQPISWKIDGKVIILFSKNLQKTETHSISGIVYDESEFPMIGVGVLEKTNPQNGVITDIDGNFTIDVKPGAILHFSFIGYKDINIAADGKKPMKVYMVPDTELLEGAVVVGYGSQKKGNLTGAISVVESKDLQNRSSLDVTRMLQGSVPGLNITNSSGRPGQAADINIRGWNSINGGSPLVLIDGVEGDLQKINPNDVESISIIKDAAAAAIYGARASFGVILVSTKEGANADKGATVRYSGRWGFTAPTTSTEYETRGYYSVLINNYFYSTYSGTPYAMYSDEDMIELWNRRNDKTEDPSRPWVVIDRRNGRDVYNYYANTDWYHVLYNDIKPTTSQSISMSGGDKKFNYLLSGSFNREQGVFKAHPDVYKKYNLRSKINFMVNDWIKVSNNTSYFSSSYDYPGVSGVNNSFSYSTVHGLASYPALNPDGSSVYIVQYNSNGVMDGLMTILDKDSNINTEVNDFVSTMTELTLTPIKQLEIKANFTYSFNNSRYVTRTTGASYSTYPGQIIDLGVTQSERWDNRLTETSSVHKYKAANAYATYSDEFANSHNLKVMAGFNYETKHLKDVKASGFNLLSEELSDLNLTGTDDEGNKKTDVSGGQNEYAIAGFFARINYDYRGKYLIEVSDRLDGTSRFMRGQRWGNFPSASVGWRISEEDFFRPAKSTVNNLKLRYSFGQLGNQQVGYYDFVRKVSLSTQSYLFGGNKSISSSIGAPVASNLTWEIVQQHNLGLDFGMFNNRLNFSAEGYIRDTKGMLTAGIPLPAIYGAASPKMNAADLRTKGYELQISWKDAFNLGSKPFEYNVSFVFSDYVSHITKFDNPERSFAKNYWVGMKYGDIWGYHVDGLFATDEEAAAYPVDQGIVNKIINASAGNEKGLRAGDLRYVDLNGNGKIDIGSNTADDPGDRRVIGNSQPRYNYGVNLGFRWYGLDFSMFIQGIGQMHWYPDDDARAFWGPYSRPYMTFIPKDFHTMYWTEDNPDAYFPRPRGYVAMNSERELGAINDRYLQNIGYCRLKNLTVGYTLPLNLTRKIGIDQVRVYFTGENLFYYAPGLHSDYIDPEMAMTGGNLRIYPWQKTCMFGIDVTFGSSSIFKSKVK